jgi:transcriptional regulator with XRE-family HTH domain
VEGLKRGRPRDDYPADDFRKRARGQIQILNLTLREIEALSGVNRGTISKVLHGVIPCAREDRQALMAALEFERSEQQRFLSSGLALPPELVLHDGAYPLSGSYLPIQRGRELLMRSMFPEARRQLNQAFTAAVAREDFVRAADAAEVLAWLEYEAMDRDNTRALDWISVSIGLIEKQVGVSLDLILASIRSGSQSAEISADDEVTPILNKVLHIRCKLLTERVIYYAEPHRRLAANAAFAQSLTLGGYRQVAEQLGHDFRWQGRLLAGDREGRDAAEKRVAESLDHCHRGSSGESLAARDRGFVYWQTGQPAKAREAFGKAVVLLAAYADARALGPAFYALSKLAGEADRLREARRHALAAAAFHPYGFVLENSRAHIRIADRRDLDHDLADLLAGRPPFDIVHSVLSRLAESAETSKDGLIHRHLSRVPGLRLGKP